MRKWTTPRKYLVNINNRGYNVSMNKQILSYTAGLFDGEGYVDIYSATKSKNSKSQNLMLRVVISQKDGGIMNWLEDNFGGYVRMERRNDSWIYRWDIRSKMAEKFLILIEPFIKIKKEQVKIAIAFSKIKGNYLDTLKGSQGFRKLTKNELGERNQLKRRLKQAKKTYIFYHKIVNIGTPTTTKRKDSQVGDVIV